MNYYAGAAYYMITQTLNNLQVGVSYDFSIDVLGVVNPSYPVSETCIFYMYHDALTTSDLITHENRIYTKSTNSWQTFSGTYTPTSSSMLFGVYMTCSPYHTTQIFNVYFDNAVAKGTSHCSTGVSMGAQVVI